MSETARKVGGSAGNRGKGRKKGVPNKTTAVLKDAILLAAEQVGEDSNGKDGLTGYLRMVAKTDVKAFAGLVGRVLPMTIGNDGGSALVVQIVKLANADDSTPGA